jgi:hypothetical protein
VLVREVDERLEVVNVVRRQHRIDLESAARAAQMADRRRRRRQAGSAGPVDPSRVRWLARAVEADVDPGSSRGQQFRFLARQQRPVRVQNRRQLESAGSERGGFIEDGLENGLVQERLAAVEANVSRRMAASPCGGDEGAQAPRSNRYVHHPAVLLRRLEVTITAIQIALLDAQQAQVRTRKCREAGSDHPTTLRAFSP